MSKFSLAGIGSGSGGLAVLLLAFVALSAARAEATPLIGLLLFVYVTAGATAVVLKSLRGGRGW